jgi:3',5'-cyclic AMP phosphodiesterase CpdA
MTNGTGSPAAGSGPIRLALLSDLHLDIRRRHLLRDGMTAEAADAAMAALQQAVRQAAAAADLVLVLGDVCEGPAGLAWVAATFRDLPALYVSGNHEFYRHDLAELPQALAQQAAASGNVRFLDNTAAEFTIRGRRLRVLGATLWTDYALYDGTPARDSMELAAARMYDHHRIAFGAGRIFQPDDALALHRRAAAWLEGELARAFPGTTIVATHHAPSPRSIEPRFQGDRMSPAFGSDLEWLMTRYRPPLWLHGHTHYNVDYRVGDTRVASHQWGYPHEGPPLGVKIVEI